MVIAPVGADGKVALYNGSGGTVQLVADVTGYFLGGPPAVAGAFGSVAPVRVLDTRIGVGAPRVAVRARGVVSVKVSGVGGVPASGVSAVALNVTVTQPGTAGYITAFADGVARPGTSNVNFVRGQTLANMVIAPVGADGKVALYNGSGGTVQLVADVTGYFLGGPPAVAGAFGSVAPVRVLDTRIGVGAPRVAVRARGVVSVKVSGVGGVPASGVSAVALNVTVTQPGTAGYITAFADGVARPGTSNVNFVRGQTLANMVIAPVGADGKVALYNGSGGTVQLVADVTGYFLGAGSAQPAPPSVVSLSSRSGSVVGGEVVTVTGTNLSGATEVAFGSAAAPTFTVASPTMLQVTTPASLPGAVDVQVTTPNGTSVVSASDQYDFVNPADSSSSEYVAASNTKTTSNDAIISVTGGGSDWSDPSTPATTPWVVTLTAGTPHPSIGDQYYLPPGGPAFPSGLAGVVSAVAAGSDGTTALTVSPSSIEDALGTATANYTGTIGDDASTAAPPAARLRPLAKTAPSLTGTINFGKISGPDAMFCKDDKGASIDVAGSLTLKLENVKAHAEVDLGGLFSKPFVDVWVQYEPTIGFDLTAEAAATCSVSRVWQTAHEKLFLLGDTGVTVAIAPDLSFSITASGTITVQQHSYRMMGFISNADGSIKRIDAKSSDPAEVTASAKLEAEAYAGVQIQVGLLDVIGVGMSVGGGVKGAIEYTPTPPQLCASVTPFLRGDLYAYLNLWIKEWKLQAFSVELDLPGLKKCTSPSDAPPTINSTTFADGTVGVPYRAVLTTADSRAGSWALSGGALPAGLSIQGASISGTPQSVGTSHAVVTFTDNNSHSASIVVTVSVSSSSGGGGGTTTTPTLPEFDVPATTVGVPMTTTYLPGYDWNAASPGIIYWSIAQGSLPPGLSLETAGPPYCGEVCYQITGTPSEAGSWPVTLNATDSLGTATVSKVFLVSAQPRVSPYTVTSATTLDRYQFTTTHDTNTDKTTMTRADSQTGTSIDVMAATNAPTLCTGAWPDYATLEATSRNANFVAIACSSNGNNGADALYLLNISAGSNTRLDVASSDYTGPIGDTSFPYQSVPRHGISDDGNQVLIFTKHLLTTNAAAETRVGEHLYVRDVAASTTQLVPDAFPVGYDAFRDAAISGDGNYVDTYGEYCTAPDGNACYNTRVGVIKSPDAATSSTLCSGECYIVKGFNTGYRTWSASADGLNVAVAANLNHYNDDGTLSAGDDVYVFHAQTSTTFDTGFIPRWSGDGFPAGVQVLLSPDGTHLFYTSELREYTCQLNDVHVNADGSFGASIVVADPPQGLPRTGCSDPVAASADNSRLLLQSNQSNLVSSPPVSDPSWPWLNYVVSI